MGRRPDAGEERLVAEAIASSPWVRMTRARRIVRAGTALLLLWLMLAALGLGLAQHGGRLFIVVSFTVVAAGLLVSFVLVVVAPERVVRWSVLSTTSSDEDANKGFPGGGG